MTARGARAGSVRSVAEARVARGVRLLDHDRPRWYERTSRDTLRMSHIQQCVLAQVYGSFGEGVIQLGVIPSEAWEFGFDCKEDDVEGMWTQLKDGWIRVVNEKVRERNGEG